MSKPRVMRVGTYGKPGTGPYWIDPFEPERIKEWATLLTHDGDSVGGLESWMVPVLVGAAEEADGDGLTLLSGHLRTIAARVQRILEGESDHDD